MTPRRLFAVLWAIAAVAAIYIVGAAVITRQSTGLLTVITPNENTSISVSQLTSQAQIIGVGGAKVRLHPGSYQVSANNGNKQATALVTIAKQHSATINLNPTQKSKLPSVGDIAFSGTDSLIDHGLTSGQVQSLKEAFFTFNSSAGKVTVNTGSISPGPRNLNAPSAVFSLAFKVSIDSATYNAKVLYSFGDSVQLLLQDAHGNQVFDSNFVPAS